MPALDRLPGLRVVADPSALDAARWTAVGVTAAGAGSTRDPDRIVVLRFAPDDAFGLGATAVEVADPHAIIADERGFVGGWCRLDDIRAHLEWAVPAGRPAVAQGSIAGVPAKLWLPGAGDVLVLTAAAHADVLAERLGWRR